MAARRWILALDHGPWTRLAAAAVLALGSSVGAGPQNLAPPLRSTTAERWPAIEHELDRIDQDRAAWVDDFLADWDRVLDPRVYRVREELTATAMRVPVWQLYGASLVGDFRTMLQVLNGVRGAGAYVNAIASPQRKVRPEASAVTFGTAGRPLALGDTSADLVFTPIAPCRVIDTRPGPDGPGARTGVLAVNTARDFDLDTSASTSGQGGGPFPCPGLPSSSNFGWAINITVTNAFTAHGGLKAWGFNSPEPNASVINWLPGQSGAIANSVVLIGCYGCADDITIKAFGDSAHVVVDVMGYFREAPVVGAVKTFLIGPVVNVPNGGRLWVPGPTCPAGTVAADVGWAGAEFGLADIVIGQLEQQAGHWAAWMINNGGSAIDTWLQGGCLDAPIGTMSAVPPESLATRSSSMTDAQASAVQRELARIDADRAAWVDDFLADWSSVLDSTSYDVRNELRPIAMQAPAWQLYGASLVSNFETMVQILRGVRGAGPYINAIDEPHRKLTTHTATTRPGSLGRPAALGSTTTDLVFTPIAPCRVVDTRNGPGARTGLMPAGTARTFDLTTEAQTDGQGGGPFPCMGLPSFSYLGWAVNITVTNAFTAQGGLKAWGAGSPEPNASVINWMPGQSGAMANGVILIGCYNCLDDIAIKTFGDAAHVIVDVMGYFREPPVASVAVTKLAGLSVSIPAGGQDFAAGADCPVGTHLIGGEVIHNGLDVAISTFEQLSAGPFLSPAWSAGMTNNDALARSVTVRSLCLDVPVRLAPAAGPPGDPDPPDAFMTAERSWTVQRELARIDANRAAWIAGFLAEWDRVLDPKRYRVTPELTPIAVEVPAWQLYGASLVGDFQTMVQVLRGVRGAGEFINSIDRPQRKLSPETTATSPGRSARPMALGSTNTELVFTPIAPCRVVDTRNEPGARTGILPANTSRTFDLTTEAQTDLQGGGPFPCPGLPSFSHLGWAVNITVTSAFTAHGGLKAWGFGSPEPNASVINWLPGQTGAVANGVILIGCYNCVDDIIIKTFGDSAHVIVDVMGYFKEAPVTGSAVSRLAGSPVVIPPNDGRDAFKPDCPVGTVRVGHEISHLGNDVVIRESHIIGGTPLSRIHNHDALSRTVTLFSRCMDTPIKK